MIPRYPNRLERNDIPAALRWLRAHFAVYGKAPGGDALAMLCQMQDDPEALMDLLEEELPKLDRNPRLWAAVYPTRLERNDVAGALRWVEEYFADAGELPDGDALEILLQLQDEPDELERQLDKLLERLDPAGSGGGE